MVGSETNNTHNGRSWNLSLLIVLPQQLFLGPQTCSLNNLPGIFRYPRNTLNNLPTFGYRHKTSWNLWLPPCVETHTARHPFNCNEKLGPVLKIWTHRGRRVHIGRHLIMCMRQGERTFVVLFLGRHCQWFIWIHSSLALFLSIYFSVKSRGWE
jgi:hypothetical protein